MRVPAPEAQYFAEIPKERVAKYENDFLLSLMTCIKEDEILSHFYIRLICECENITGVVDKTNSAEIIELEEIIENLQNAKSIELVSQYDTEFHRRLFALTGEVDFLNGGGYTQ